MYPIPWQGRQNGIMYQIGRDRLSQGFRLYATLPGEHEAVAVCRCTADAGMCETLAEQETLPFPAELPCYSTITGVDLGHQGQGLARALLAHEQEELKKIPRGVHVLTFMDDGLERLRPIYLRFGYEPLLIPQIPWSRTEGWVYRLTGSQRDPCDS